MTRGRRAIDLVLIACGVLSTAAVAAPAQTNLEYSVKANYLVRFAAFVVWPARSFSDQEAPVVICVAGRDPFGTTLDQAARGQTAHGRPLVVRRPASREAVTGCHILYIGRGGEALITSAAGQPGLLMVTDAATGPNRGTVHFELREARVRFHIDRLMATRNGLAINSRLLNLALSVRAG